MTADLHSVTLTDSSARFAEVNANGAKEFVKFTGKKLANIKTANALVKSVNVLVFCSVYENFKPQSLQVTFVTMSVKCRWHYYLINK